MPEDLMAPSTAKGALGLVEIFRDVDEGRRYRVGCEVPHLEAKGQDTDQINRTALNPRPPNGRSSDPAKWLIAGWTADWISPLTGKRRQVVVESEDAGWALIQQEGQAAATAEDKARRTGVKQAPAAPMGGFSLQQAWELSWERRFKGQAQARIARNNYTRISGFFGSRTQLCSISNIWFNQWRESMLAEGLKPSNINRVASTLLAMRADALLFGKVTDLPMLPKALRVTKIPPRFLSQEEVNLLVSFFRARGDQQMEDMFLFRISEGCRFEETQRLTPRDFDFRLIRSRSGSQKTKAPGPCRWWVSPVRSACADAVA